MKGTLLLGSLIIGAGYYYAKNSFNALLKKYKNAFQELDIELNSLRNLNITGSKLTADVILNLINPTDIDLGVDAKNLVILKKLIFYTQSGLFIGEAYPSLANIMLPRNSTLTTPEIPVEIPLDINAINVGFELLLNSRNIKVVTEIEALNNTYTF